MSDLLSKSPLVSILESTQKGTTGAWHCRTDEELHGFPKDNWQSTFTHDDADHDDLDGFARGLGIELPDFVPGGTARHEIPRRSDGRLFSPRIPATKKVAGASGRTKAVTLGHGEGLYEPGTTAVWSTRAYSAEIQRRQNPGLSLLPPPPSVGCITISF